MATRTIRTGAALLGAIALSALPAAAQTFLRAHDDVVIGAPRALHPAGPARRRPATTASTLTVLAFHGEVLEDGGTLNPLAFTNPATINGSTTIAFFSLVDGVERNQGISGRWRLRGLLGAHPQQHR